jgi:hypothetical protein
VRDHGVPMIFPEVDVTLKIVSSRDGNAVTCLGEHGRYEYELDSRSHNLRELPGLVVPSRISRSCGCGVITPGNYVGLFKLTLIENSSGSAVSHLYIDVRSQKLDYESEYRTMLEDIAERCSDLLIQIDSPAVKWPRLSRQKWALFRFGSLGLWAAATERRA